ncbi:MAG: hypothetical protein J7L55_00085 [Desulfurococcales archaeon]|nr:hypothetical protein [Desulfurococcales archaeon]
MRREVRERIPIAYVPIPGRSNPVAIVSTYNSLIIDVSLGEHSVVGGSISEAVANMVGAFLRRLERVVGEIPPLEISVFASGSIIDSFTYAAVTNAVLEFLGGKLDSDMIRAAQEIDKFLGCDHSILALREFPLRGSLYIWRDGEGGVDSEAPVVVDVNEDEVVEMVYNPPPYLDMITHLAGVATIDSFKLLSEGKVPNTLKVLNALWHALYGIPLRSWKVMPYAAIKDVDGARFLEIKEVGFLR